MPHGREQKGDLVLVMWNVGGLVLELRHEDEIAGGVAGGEAGEGWGELIAEDGDEVAYGGHSRKLAGKRLNEGPRKVWE